MRRWPWFVAGVALIATSLAPDMTPAAAGEAPTGPPDQYIVVVAEGHSPNATAANHRDRHGARILHVYTAALRGYAARMSPTAARRVATDPRVVSVTPDQYVSVDAQTLPTGINRAEAEMSPTARIDGVDERVDVDVAVLDTGIAPHPDLHIAGGRNCVRHERGTIDRNGHGTHVAGTIAALDNDLGVVGVAPGARVWSVKVLDQFGSGSWASVICGIDWVTARAHAIEVVNMSLSGAGTDGSCASDPLHRAICRSVARGLVYAVGAGNLGSDVSAQVPGTFDEVITVSALADFDGLPGGLAEPTCFFDEDDTFADFSNYGADVDLIAPGMCILSTWLDGGYAELSGTSQAAPHVAGAAALFKARHPGATPAEVRSALRASGRYRWRTDTDPDGIADPLLDVRGL